MIALILFPFFYLKEIIVGTAMIMRDIVSPRQALAPVLLHMPLSGKLSPRQRLLLACLISMTPGTISVAEQNEGRTMLIHSLYGANSPQSTINHLKERYEAIVMQLPI